MDVRGGECMRSDRKRERPKSVASMSNRHKPVRNRLVLTLDAFSETETLKDLERRAV